MNKTVPVLIVALLCVTAFVPGVLAGPWVGPTGKKSVPLLIPYQGVLERNGSLVDAIGQQKVDFRVAPGPPGTIPLVCLGFSVFHR